MTAKEKAKELLDKMYMVEDHMGKYPMCFNTAKECALIAAEEIIDVISTVYEHDWNVLYPYWNEVKQEIINL